MLTDADLDKIKTITKEVTRDVVKQALKPIKKDIKTIISFFDHETIRLKKRVDRIEEHLHLPPLS